MIRNSTIRHKMDFGVSKMNAPRLVATPLPPRNLSHTGEYVADDREERRRGHDELLMRSAEKEPAPPEPQPALYPPNPFIYLHPSSPKTISFSATTLQVLSIFFPRIDISLPHRAGDIATTRYPVLDRSLSPLHRRNLIVPQHSC